MTKEKAIEFLKYLHQKERDASGDVFRCDEYVVVTEIRFEFLKLYNTAPSGASKRIKK